jgi:hypothetical protein
MVGADVAIMLLAKWLTGSNSSMLMRIKTSIIFYNCGKIVCKNEKGVSLKNYLTNQHAPLHFFKIFRKNLTAL